MQLTMRRLQTASTLVGHPPIADQRSDFPSYLIVVARSQPTLFQHLRAALRDDAKTVVIIDRRQTPRSTASRRQCQREDALAAHGVVVIRLDLRGGRIATDVMISTKGGERMDEADVLNERQRIDRWLEESQYLTGRLIPTFLDDRERLKSKMDALESEAERLRAELNEIRRELSQAQGEVQFYKNEHAAMADTFSGIMEQFGQMQRPLTDVYRRLQAPHAQSVG